MIFSLCAAVDVAVPITLNLGIGLLRHDTRKGEGTCRSRRILRLGS